MSKLPKCPAGYNSGTASIDVHRSDRTRSNGKIEFDFAGHKPYSVVPTRVGKVPANNK